MESLGKRSMTSDTLYLGIGNGPSKFSFSCKHVPNVAFRFSGFNAD